MKLYSTNKKSPAATLEEAVMLGLANDGGLFQLETIEKLPTSFFKDIHSLTFSEIAFAVASTLLKDTIPSAELKKITTFPFDSPLKKLSTNLYALELFHGPTLSFKDFGAHFMAQLMSYFMRHKSKTLNILVATSGDTGSAIGQGFLNAPHTRVWILYPKGKISPMQEKQITTIGGNATAIEVDGTFDDCQKLVKQAFSDDALREKIFLTSANSINIARLIPQTFYYFSAYAQLKNPSLPLVFSVPSGNFGNLTGGLLAKRMGLPISHFVAATNVNDSVPQYLKTGIFKPHPTKHTLSNAMDVGNPSNFARIIDLYNNDWNAIRNEIYGASFTDHETEEAIRTVLQQFNYLLDPHSAVAYLGLEAYRKTVKEPFNGIFLSTAHPAKFATDVERIIGSEVPSPKRLADSLLKEKHAVFIQNNYQDLKKLITI